MLISAAAIFGLSLYCILLQGKIDNQAVRIANLEQRLCQVEAMQAAEAKHAVKCN